MVGMLGPFWVQVTVLSTWHEDSRTVHGDLKRQVNLLQANFSSFFAA